MNSSRPIKRRKKWNQTRNISHPGSRPADDGNKTAAEVRFGLIQFRVHCFLLVYIHNKHSVLRENRHFQPIWIRYWKQKQNAAEVRASLIQFLINCSPGLYSQWAFCFRKWIFRPLLLFGFGNFFFPLSLRTLPRNTITECFNCVCRVVINTGPGKLLGFID